jgi:hypothetical protein
MAWSAFNDSVWADDPRDMMRLRKDVPRRTYSDAPYGFTGGGTGGGQTSQTGVYTDPFTGQAGSSNGASGTNGVGSLGGVGANGVYDPQQGPAPPSPSTVQNDPGSTQGDIAPFEQGSPVANNPYAFQYGNTTQDPEAAGWAAQYNAMANGAANITAPQMQNPNATPNLQRSEGIIGQEGQTAGQIGGAAGSLGSLGGFEASIANGTGPNLAQAQMNASTDQGIAAQMAMAHSAPGSLAASSAMRNAATQGVATQQNAAEQSAINTIQQQQAAAQSAGSLYGAQAGAYGTAGGVQSNMGTQAQGITGTDETTAEANLAAQQQAALANQQAGLQYSQLTQGVLGSSEAAQEAGQNNRLGMGAQGIQQQQVNNAQNNAVAGAVTTGLGVLGTFADADLQEPGGSAAWTLREESGGPGHDPFILALDRQGGRALKLATQPLTPSEHEQAFGEPHGAGPLGEGDPRRQRTVANDMQMFQPQGQQLMRPGMPPAPQQAFASQRPPMPQMGAPMQAQRLVRPPMASGPAMPQQMARPAPPQMQPRPPMAGLAQMFAPRPQQPGALTAGIQQAPPPGTLGGMAAGMGAFADMDLKHGHYADVDDLALPAAESFAADPHNAPTPAAVAAAQQRPVDTGPLGFLNPQSGVAPPPAGPEGPKDPATLVKMQPPPAAAPAAASGAGTVPGMGGGPVKSAWVPNAPPGTIDAVKSAEGAEASADDDAVRASQHALEDASVGHLQRADTIKKGADEQAAATAAHDLWLTQQEQRRDLLSQDAKKAGENVGWHPTTGTRIQYGIAAALGAFGASLGHGQNAALEIINGAINRDLDSQKQAVESKKGRVADMDTALAQAYRRFGNMDQAMAAARSTKLQEVDEQIAAYAGASQQESVKAQAETARAQIKRQQALEDSKLYAHVTTGGAGGNLAQKYQAYVTGELAKPGGKAMSYPEFARALSGAGGESQATKPGAGKINPKAAAIDASLAIPTHGQDFYDRNAPDFLRSSESLSNEAALAAQARAGTAAIGRAPPLTMSNPEVLRATMGRPTPEAVAAFKRRAAETAATMRNTASEGAPEPVE